MENSHRCEVCKIDTRRASLAIHLRSKMFLEKEKNEGMFIPEWLFTEPIENKNKKK